MQRMWTVLAACSVACAAAAEVSISDVQLRQRWPWGPQVDIYYTISGAEKPVSVEATFTARGGEVVPVPDVALSGERHYVSNGRHHMVWNPSDQAYAGRTLFADLTVTLETVDNPLYMIVDLPLGRGTEAVTYVREDDLHAGKWGVCETNPCPGQIESLIWTGVTNDIAYRQRKLVLRYIPPTTSAEWTVQKGKSSFTMGAADGVTEASSRTDATANAVYDLGKCRPQGEVTLTKGYWLGVFEVTQWQWLNIYGAEPSTHTNADRTRPHETLDWGVIRGSNYNGAKWPQKGHLVLETTFMSRLRLRTGLMFDLPTEAQWEFAARAGAEGLGNDNLAEVAHFGADSETATAVVGSYRPNAWGLYDTLGNVREGTLSAFDEGRGYTASDFGTDPVGLTLNDPYRTVRGGGWEDGPAGVNLHVRERNAWSAVYDSAGRRFGEGFRVWLEVE